MCARATVILLLAVEAMQFRVAGDSTAYALILRGYGTSYEDDWHRLPLSGLHPDYLLAMPPLVDVPAVAWLALTGAHLENYAGLYVTARNARPVLRLELAPGGCAIRITPAR